MKTIKITRNTFKNVKYNVKVKVEPVCEDYDTGKTYKSHKWEDDSCDCPLCPTRYHEECTRCYEKR